MLFSPKRASRLRRRPGIELLEDRAVPATLTVNSLADNVTAGDGLVTLREAINAANTDTPDDNGETGSGADTIQFDPTLFSGGAKTLSMTLGEFAIKSNVTINGPGANLLTLDAQKNSRVFNISNPDNGAGIEGFTHAPVSLSGLTMTNGVAPTSTGDDRGGAILSEAGSFDTAADGGLTLSHCTITQSASTGVGGGILCGGLVTIDTCIISNNTADEGGGIGTYGSTVIVNNSVVSGNHASFGGGFGNIYTDDSESIQLTNTQVIGNTADQGGGGIFAYRVQSLSLVNSTVSGNTAPNGGGVFVDIPDSSTLNIQGSTISGNTATSDGGKGGGVYLLAPDSPAVLSIVGSTLSGNKAGVAGGTSGGSGGGIYESGGGLTIQDSTITGNSALGTGASGGGLAATAGDYTNNKNSYSNPALTLTNSTITGNTSAGTTGGASLSADILTLSSNLIAGNTDNGTDPDLILSEPAIFTPVVTFDHNLIGNNTGSGLTATTGRTPDASGNFIGSAASPINPLLSPLGNYGGNTQTMPLLPGSLALDHGAANGLTTDQRGAARTIVAATDIGAFESQGFNVALVSGNNQSTAVNTAFPAPLTVSVTSIEVGVPVAGGVVVYTGPATGASIAPNPSTAPIASGGQAALTATANGTGGSYSVVASSGGPGNTATFSLTNTANTPPPPGVTLSGGVLDIVGTNGNDNISVSQQGSVITVNAQLGNGTTVRSTYNASAVTSISIYTGNGNDNVQVANGVTVPTLVITSGSGNDNIQFGNSNTTVTAGNGNNNVQGGNGNNSVTLGNGNDNVTLGNGNDTVTLGNGNDNVTVGNGNDTIKAGNGNDNVTAGNGNDNVTVGNGNDNIHLGNGNDTVTAGDGHDNIHLGSGHDTVTRT